MAKMKLKKPQGGGKYVKAPEKPTIQPNAKVRSTGDPQKDSYAQYKADNRSSAELTDERANMSYVIATSKDKNLRSYAVDKSNRLDDALEARRKTQEQDRKYVTKTIAPKYSSGGTVGKEKKSLTGKVVKKAKPVSPAYLPSDKVKQGGGNPLGYSKGGETKTKNLSTSISGAGMVKPKKMKLAKK